MREYFSQFGKVVDATVMLDRETGRSKGFGFVSFENADVQPLLGFGNLEIDGKLVSPCIRSLAHTFDLVLPVQIDVKLAQPRSQRENFSEGGGQSGYGRGSGNYGGQGSGFATAPVAAAAGATGTAPFDPQQLAQLYTRMMQQMGINPMMAGGMNMMSGMGGGFGGMGGGRMVPGMAAMAMAGNMGAGMGMGRGGAGMAQGGMSPGGGMGPNVPRGPRNGPGGPGGPAGVGPQRAGQRGQHQHNYHPYAR